MIDDGNRHSYVLAKDLMKYRYKADWQSRIDNDDYGLIVHNKDLSNLEIIVLELTSSCHNPDNPYEEDMLGYVLGKWFREMNVKHYKTYKTDLPINTKVRIDKFLNNEQ